MTKQKTRWRRVYNPIIGVRFSDGGEYGLGYFTIIKLWQCKEYCSCAAFIDDSHWFPKTKMRVRTDTGLVYDMPFFPWLVAWDDSGMKKLSDYYNENNVMSSAKEIFISTIHSL